MPASGIPEILGMVESRRQPRSGRMARCAVVAISTEYVIRALGNCKVRRVTRIAVRVLYCVVPIRMTRLARRRDVRTGQRKCRLRVIERCRTPCRHVMARRTVVAEVPRYVRRVRGSREIR
jgi:hypothetical protein